MRVFLLIPWKLKNEKISHILKNLILMKIYVYPERNGVICLSICWNSGEGQSSGVD